MRGTIWKKEIRMSPASDAFILILINPSEIMHGESKAKAASYFSILGSYLTEPRRFKFILNCEVHIPNPLSLLCPPMSSLPVAENPIASQLDASIYG